MNATTVLALMQETLKTAALLAAPMLVASMATGLLMSILQTVTSIQEQSLTFVPKVGVSILVGIIVLPWGLQTMIAFTVRVYQISSTLGH